MQIIPVSPRADQTLKTTVDGETIRMRIFWSTNASSWFIDIDGISFDLSVKGLRLCTGVLMLDGLAIREIGDFFVIDSEEKLADPDREGLGSRFLLAYWTKEELGYDIV